MLKQGLQYFTDTHLTVAGLGIFLLMFFSVLVWVSLKQNKARYQQIEQLPLD